MRGHTQCLYCAMFENTTKRGHCLAHLAAFIQLFAIEAVFIQGLGLEAAFIPRSALEAVFIQLPGLEAAFI